MARISPPGKRTEHTTVALLEPDRLRQLQRARTCLLHAVTSCSPSRAPATHIPTHPPAPTPRILHTPAVQHFHTPTHPPPLPFSTHTSLPVHPSSFLQILPLQTCPPWPSPPHIHARARACTHTCTHTHTHTHMHSHRGATTRLLDGLACSSTPDVQNSGLAGTPLPRS